MRASLASVRKKPLLVPVRAAGEKAIFAVSRPRSEALPLVPARTFLENADARLGVLGVRILGLPRSAPRYLVSVVMTPI